MENKWKSFLHKLQNLRPNYGASDFSLAYRELQNSININEVIGYDNRTYKGAFHFALSVQILSEGAVKKFIPFVSVLNGDENKYLIAKKWVQDSIDNKSVKYNYTDFFDDVRNLDEVKNALNHEELSRISFQTNITKEGYTISNIFLNSGHHRDSMNNGSSDGIFLPESKNLIQLLRDKGKTDKGIAADFIQLLSVELYKNSIGIDTLYYTIYGLDGDYKTGERLTHILMISEDPNEIKDFCAKDFYDGYIRKIRDISSCIRTRYTYDLIQKNKWEALKSAVSAIMSRNMSHNLGSHYLYYTKTYLEDLANNSESLGPDIRGAAKVLGYMQARMDYLATVISNDRYPNGAVNFKSQLYDELTVDDFSKRHFSKDDDKYRRTTNFLLANIIKSENFSRSSIVGNESLSKQDKIDGNFMPITLCVKLWNEKTGEFELFTGSSDETIMSNETEVKNQLSKINIALPGGTMSAHAFFNVVENFIRNSAKYLREDFDKRGLVFTITIKRNETDNQLFDIVIYDNKKNANKVLPIINNQLQELAILDETGSIEKAAKGIKEMLFSSIWMRSYNYPKETFVDIIHRIQDEENPAEKIKLIEHYGFTFVAVAESGKVEKDSIDKCNLGIQITLPEFSLSTSFKAKESDTEKDIIANCLKISSDIVCLSPKTEKMLVKHPDFFTYFTRLFYEKQYNEEDFKAFYKSSRVLDKSDDETAEIAYRFKSVLDERFNEETGGNIDNICLQIGGGRRDTKHIPRDNKYIVYFERHLNNKGFGNCLDFAYVDSISGGNFTITLNSLIDEGITKGTCLYKTWSDKLLGLKIKESALTRITLIDERLYNSMESDGEQRKLEFALKNIRVLNVNIEKEINDIENLEDLLEGNKFMDDNDSTHFLSIHLGLIEKIVKSDWGRKKYGEDAKLEDNVTRFMEDLQRIFGKGKRVFISVHSGRGNFSKELEGPLASYPFISLSAIENAFNNSKYLLTQLFYNTIYIGKGKINK